MTLKSAGGAVSRRAPQRGARDRTHAAQHPVREVRRPEVSRFRPREGRARGAALGREPARSRGRAFASLQLLPGVGPAIAGRVLDQVARARRHAGCVGRIRRAAARERRLAGASSALMSKVCGRESGWPAEFEMIRRWYEPHLERNHEDAAIRHGDVLQMEKHRVDVSHARAFSHRTDARSARRHERRIGRSAASTRII